MFVTLYKSSPEGSLSVEIEQEYLPNALQDCLKIPDQYNEAIEAGWDYFWQYDDISDRQLNASLKEPM